MFSDKLRASTRKCFLLVDESTSRSWGSQNFCCCIWSIHARTCLLHNARRSQVLQESSYSGSQHVYQDLAEGFIEPSKTGSISADFANCSTDLGLDPFSSSLAGTFRASTARRAQAIVGLVNQQVGRARHIVISVPHTSSSSRLAQQEFRARRPRRVLRPASLFCFVHRLLEGSPLSFVLLAVDFERSLIPC